MRLVAGSSAITLKLSSRICCTGVFKGWYVSIRGILLIFSSVEFNNWNRSATYNEHSTDEGHSSETSGRLLRFWHFHQHSKRLFILAIVSYVLCSQVCGKSPGGGGVLPYMGYIGMCGPKG